MKHDLQKHGQGKTRPDRRRRGVLPYLAFVIVKLAMIPVVALGVAVSVYIRTSPYPPTEALMHLVARAGCPAAVAIGLAGARKGELGYHARNDIDGNGIACGRATPTQGPALVLPGAGQSRTVGGAKFIQAKPSGG